MMPCCYSLIYIETNGCVVRIKILVRCKGFEEDVLDNPIHLEHYGCVICVGMILIDLVLLNGLSDYLLYDLMRSHGGKYRGEYKPVLPAGGRIGALLWTKSWGIRCSLVIKLHYQGIRCTVTAFL